MNGLFFVQKLYFNFKTDCSSFVEKSSFIVCCCCLFHLKDCEPHIISIAKTTLKKTSVDLVNEVFFFFFFFEVALYLYTSSI